MSTIHILGGEQSGVGKPPVARLLAQYSIDHQRLKVWFNQGYGEPGRLGG